MDLSKVKQKIDNIRHLSLTKHPKVIDAEICNVLEDIFNIIENLQNQIQRSTQSKNQNKSSKLCNESDSWDIKD